VVDPHELRDYLLMRRAPDELVAWALSQDAEHFADHLENLPPLAYEDCELLLGGILEIGVTDTEALEQRTIQRFLQLCEQLGFDDAWIDGFMKQQVGMSLEVVTALAWMHLPRTADEAEIAKAHRSLAKLYHPDRASHLAQELQDLAKLRTQQLNRARDALIEWVRVVPLVPIEDDFPDIDWRDAHTDVSGEVPLHGVADLDLED
jgi:hypothetical protein